MAAAMASTATAAARRASISAASFTMRSGPVTSTTRRKRVVRKRRLQIDHETRPGVIADRGSGRGAHESGDDRDRVLGLFPGADREHVGSLDDTRRFEARHHEHRVAVGRQDEHREPLERHRLVAGEVRQVRPRRQQQHVDAQFPHPGTGALDPRGVHG